MQDMLGRISMLDATREGRSKNLLLGSIAALFGLFLLGVNNVLGPSASAVLVALLGVALAVQAPPAVQTLGPVADEDPEAAAGLAFMKRSGGVRQLRTAHRRQPHQELQSARAWNLGDHRFPQQQIVELRAQEAKASRACNEAQAEAKEAAGRCRDMAARLQSLSQELQREREASESEREQTSHATLSLKSQVMQLQKHREAFVQEARLASDKLARSELEHKIELQQLEQTYVQELQEQHQVAERAQRDAAMALEDAEQCAAQLVAQQQQCRAWETEVARLKEQFSQRKEAYEEATSFSEVVEQKLESLQRDHDRKQQQNKETCERLQQVESALEEARAAADQGEANAARVRKQMHELKRSQNDELEELRSREQRAVKLAEAAQREALRSSASSAEWERQAADLRIEHSAMQTQLQVLEEERRNWQQQRRRSRAETDEAAGRLAHLSAQLQRLQQDNASLQQQARAVKEHEAKVAKQLEQAQLETNKATASASELLHQLENCQQELGEMKADERGTADKAKWASKLATQLKELQKEHDEAHRQRRGLLADLQQERYDLEKQRQAAQRSQEALVQERKRSLLLEAELNKCKEDLRHEERRSTAQPERIRHASTMPLHRPSDEAAIETLGAMLQRSMQQAPLETRQNFKRQLLLCFHPDRNPAKEVATRVTQILNCTD